MADKKSNPGAPTPKPRKDVSNEESLSAELNQLKGAIKTNTPEEVLNIMGPDMPKDPTVVKAVDSLFEDQPTETEEELTEEKTRPKEDKKKEGFETPEDELAWYKKKFGDSQNLVGDMRRELDSLKGAFEERSKMAAEQNVKPITHDDLGRQIYGEDWKDIKSDQITYDDMMRAQMKLVQMTAQAMNAREQKLAQEMDDLRVENVAVKHGLDDENIQAQLMAQHPWLQSMPKKARMDAMRDLKTRETAPSEEAPSVPTLRSPALKAEHVIESHGSGTPKRSGADAVEAAMESFGGDPKKELQFLSEMFKRSGSW